ncbi:MAG: hypothetical protein IJ676_04440 [Clostridia bacterium]|nr:hypothetical protein [Clostridia bacterium]
MPFIITRTNVSIDERKERELKTKLGNAIELIPGKSEEYLLLSFEDNQRLWLRGNKIEPIAYVEASIFGNDDHVGFDRFTVEVTKILYETLSVPPQNVYIKYEDIKVWSVYGRTFDITRWR